jgi:acyl transferase domain-containing protein
MLILPISANTENALTAYAAAYSKALRAIPAERFPAWMAAACGRKSDLRLRKAVVAASAGELAGKLADLENEELEGVVEAIADPQAVHRTIFVFPGQGSQWPGMGKRLFDLEPVFAAEIEAWEQAISRYADWSLKEELFGRTGDDALSSIDVIQPALVAMECALARLWLAWGIEPDAVLGHSMGEVAAAYIAGMLSIEDAAAVICHRSALMKTTSGQGAMGYAALTPEAMAERLSGKESHLGIAVNNSPDSVVVSGDAKALDELFEELEREEIFCRRIRVDVASHSPQMDAITADLRREVAHIEPKKGAITFYSTVRQDIAEGPELDADYWVKNLRQPVQFAATVSRILEDGATCFLEMSPHTLLIQAIRENAAHAGKAIVTGGSLHRDEDDVFSFYKSIGQAWCNGLSPDWPRLYGPLPGHMDLPSYPWDRESFWIDESGVDETARPAVTKADTDIETGIPVSFRDEVLGMDDSRALEAIEARLKELTGSVVRKKAVSIRNSMAFKTLGIDSLMAVQLKEKLEKVFELPVSVTSFWTYATIAEYSRFIAVEIGLGNKGESTSALSAADDISDDDISDLLAGELEDLL